MSKKEEKEFFSFCSNIPEYLGIWEKVSFAKLQVYSLTSSHLAGWWWSEVEKN